MLILLIMTALAAATAGVWLIAGATSVVQINHAVDLRLARTRTGVRAGDVVDI